MVWKRVLWAPPLVEAPIGAADVYVTVAEELADAATSAIEAFVLRKSKVVPVRASNVPASDEK